MLLINTSIKEGNNTGRVVRAVAHYLQQMQWKVDVAEMIPFAPFTGSYLKETTAVAQEAAPFVHKIERAVNHLYFVPTYYKMMPGAFKNYLDITRMASLYHGKRIGIVATNAKNQDYGARQFLQTLLGLLEFHHAVSVIIPQLLILDPEAVDLASFQQYLDYYVQFPVPTVSPVKN